MKLSKAERHETMIKKLDEIPFLTDEDLAKRLKVSVPTIRLDRLELGIPELRERVKNLANTNMTKVKSLNIDEVIGEIIDLNLNNSGISILEIQKHHVFQKTKIARGHYIFAQANSLAVALIDEEIALTAKAEVKYIRPILQGEKCIAKAELQEANSQENRYIISVKTYVEKELVFEGTFKISKYRDNK